MIRQKLDRIHENITDICRKIGRDPSEITLVAVTKYATVAQIRRAVESGVTDIGESKVQDARDKFAVLGETLSRRDVRRHMIGHLQTNKVKPALQLFDMIQSVDSVRLVRELEKQAGDLGRSVDILIEVNTSGEAQKFGVAPADTLSLVDAVRSCRFIFLKGFMTVGPYTDDELSVRNSFRALRRLGEEVRAAYRGEQRIDARILSMGMTHDYGLALEEGATMLRIGSAIFGG